MSEPRFSDDDFKILDSFGIYHPVGGGRTFRYSNMRNYLVLARPLENGYAIMITRLDFSASYSEQGNDLEALIKNAMQHCVDKLQVGGWLASAVESDLKQIRFWEKQSDRKDN